MRQTLVSCAVALPLLGSLAACASGQPGTTAFAPAPASKSGLRSAGYVAPEIGGGAPRTASQAQAAPVRIARAAVPEPVALERAAFVSASAAPETAQPVTARLGAAPQAEVPAAPARDWTAPPRAPLPDLDEIVVTRESQRLAAIDAEAPPTRSVLPEAAPRPASRPSGERPVETGGYALHLASYRRAEQAEAGWQVLSAAHPGALAPLAPARAVIDLEGQGRFHRLLAGPLSAEAATTACAALEREGDYCAVVPWTGTRL